MYQKALQWIADNDEPTWRDVEQVSQLISVALVADLFNRTLEQVARGVVALRN